MAEQTSEQLSQSSSFEKSKNLTSVVTITMAATKKIGAAIGKVASEIIGMIFK